MKQKSPLHANAMRQPAYRDVLIRPAASGAQYCAFEDLDAFAIPLDDFHVHANRVAREDIRQVVFQLLLLNALENRAHVRLPHTMKRRRSASRNHLTYQRSVP